MRTWRPPLRRRSRVFLPLLAAGALSAGVLAQPGAASAAASPAPGGPGQDGAAWQRYVEGPRSADVRPVRVVSVSGDGHALLARTYRAIKNCPDKDPTGIPSLL